MNAVTKNPEANRTDRVIGLDSHPDSFTAAVVRGPTPAAAIVEKTFNKVPLGQLQSWAKKHTTAEDLIVLEASGNSFQVVRILAAIERKALVLESGHVEVTRGGKPVNRLGPGDFFGEIGMLDRGTATATVVTDGPVEAIVLSHTQFRDAIKANDNLALQVIAAMAKRLRADAGS